MLFQKGEFVVLITDKIAHKNAMELKIPKIRNSLQKLNF